MEKPEKVVRIALDDYVKALKWRISGELYGKIEDELKRNIPNMLKDEKKRVEYKATDDNQHIIIINPKHDITITRIAEETI